MRSLRDLATKDHLTGTYSPRAAEVNLAEDVARAERGRAALPGGIRPRPFEAHKQRRAHNPQWFHSGTYRRSGGRASAKLRAFEICGATKDVVESPQAWYKCV